MDEFKIARDEACEYGILDDESEFWCKGADWAYQWCQELIRDRTSDVQHYHKQNQQLKEKLAIAVEALKELRGKTLADGPWIINDALKQITDKEV